MIKIDRNVPVSVLLCAGDENISGAYPNQIPVELNIPYNITNITYAGYKEYVW